MDALAVARPFWAADPGARRGAWARLALVLALQVARGKADATLAGFVRAQVAALASVWEQRSLAPLVRVLAARAALVVCFAPLDALYERVLRDLKCAWGRHLTEALLRVYLRLSLGSRQSGGSASDALAQHLAEDVDKYVDLFLDLGLEAVQAGIHLVFYARLLWWTSPTLSKGSVALAALGTHLTLALGKRMPSLYARERAAASDYRYALSRLRDNAESIELYGGESNEVSELRRLHDAKQQRIWLRKERRDFVGQASGVFRKLAGFLPLLHLSATDGVQEHLGTGRQDHGHSHHGHSHHGHSHVSHGHSHGHGNAHGPPSPGGPRPELERVGAILEASEAFDEILYHLMIIAENLNDFARLGTVSAQLRAMLAAEQAKAGPQAGPDSAVALVETDYTPKDLAEGAPWLELRGLTLSCRNELLVANLTLVLTPGCRLLITGESGVGKTTLLRAVQGLHRSGSGHVRRPQRDTVFFVPQQPYMTLGSLREQLLYPLPKDDIGPDRDQELLQVLALVGLEALAPRGAADLSRVARWSEELSVGEQQRLAFARVVLLRPARPFVFLDEATSACDLVSESRMYALLTETCASWVSVGHRQSIERYHDQRLVLRRGGQWDLEPLP